jgi:hypothetical protein
VSPTFNTQQESVSRSQLFLFVTLFAIAAIGYAYTPLLTSWYIGDDWHFFALYRHLDSPLSIVSENPVSSYFYRPIPLLLGWSAFKLFELDTLAHYSLSIALHVWVAIEIYRLSMFDACSRAKPIAIAMAALFVLLPLNAGTVAWISNRFDLMATAASLAAIRCAYAYAVAPSARPLIAMSAWAIVACLSKESGFAAIPACAFAVFGMPHFDWRARAVHAPIACLALIVITVFASRFIALGFLLPPTSDLPQPVGYVEGVMRWATALTTTMRENASSSIAVGVVATASALLAATSNGGSRQSKFIIASVLIYAIVVIVAQAPIAKAAFPDGAVYSVSFRFFYSTFASIFLCATITILKGTNKKSFSSALGAVSFAVIGALAVNLAHASHEFNAKWRLDTQFRREGTLTLARELQTTAATHATMGTRCVLRLSDEVDASLNFDGFLDLTLKAHLSQGDPAVNCLVIGKHPIATSFTRIVPCEKASFTPFRSIDDRIPTIAVGGVCKYFFLRE